MAILFDGKSYALAKGNNLREKVALLKEKGINLTLASVYLSIDSGSALYTRLKKNTAKSIGIEFLDYEIKDKDVEKFVSLIKDLNNDTSINGILVQKPSGANDFTAFNWKKIVLTLNPEKDVDGLTPENLGLLSIGTPRFIPATVKAVLDVLEAGKISVKGKHTVLLGASEILGRPLSMILTDMGATVSILHSATEDLKRYTTDADILVSATGVLGIISANSIKEGAVVIDVGAPKGDVKTDEVSQKASFLSPVPGGVGPVTIVCLLENLVVASSR